MLKLLHRQKRRVIALAVAALLVLSVLISPAFALSGPEISSYAAVLIECSTGNVLYEKNAHEALEPASVTKIMTLLLVMEAIDEGRISVDDMVTVSSHASSMGGSQIWLKEGEQMSVHDLLKAVCVNSANDAAVALAELVAGSEDAFVNHMNERALELGMENTSFYNCSGLPGEHRHVTSAWDIALMSRELLKHGLIKEYTTIWMDSLRGGETELVNTNRLIRFYEGTTGIKTGSTTDAMYCLAASAERDGIEYIAVVMKDASSDGRFDSAKALLDYAFANFTLTDVYPGEVLLPVTVNLGETATVQPVLESASKILVERSQLDALEKTVTLEESVDAPVMAGDKLGTLTISSGGKVLEIIPLVAADDVERLTWFTVFTRMLSLIFTGAV